MEEERAHQHVGLGVDQGELQPCLVGGEDSLEVITCPADPINDLGVLEVLTQRLGEHRVRVGFPLSLQANQVVALEVVLAEPDAQPPREAEPGQVGVLRGLAAGQRRDRGIREEGHSGNRDAIDRGQHLLRAGHRAQSIVSVADQRTHGVGRQGLSGVEVEGEHVLLRLALPQERLVRGLLLLDGQLVFSVLELPSLDLLLELGLGVLQLLGGELDEQLVAVVEGDLAPQVVELLLEGLRVHITGGSYLAQFPLLLEVEVDEAVGGAFEGVVRGVGPHRILAAIQREEHVGDVVHVQRTLG